MRFLTKFAVFWHCHTLDLSDTGLCDRPIFDTTVGSVMCDRLMSVDTNGCFVQKMGKTPE